MLRCFLHPVRIPLGDFLFLEIDGAICALCNPQQLPAYQNKLQKLLSEELHFSYTSTELLLEAERQLSEYFSGNLREFTLPIRLYGTAFQQKVWEQLAAIPYGSSTSYGKIAASLSMKGAQAVGNAVGNNPLPIIIPCHRVLPTNGTLGNFSMQGGSAAKAFLLDLEQIAYQ